MTRVEFEDASNGGGGLGCDEVFCFRSCCTTMARRVPSISDTLILETLQDFI